MTPDDTPKPRALGRGLSALIGEEAVPTRGEERARAEGSGSKAQRTLPVAFLRPGQFQPRKRFAEDDLRDLAASVREKGVLQPILVRPLKGAPDSYEIVAGERRWRAAQMAKLHDVPVVVREMDDREALELAIIENVQRADLNAIEEAAAYNELIAHFGYTQDQVAKEVGKSRPYIANTLRLLKLPDSVKTMLREGQLTAGHARTLLGASDPEAMAREILSGGMNVREAEERAKKPGGAKGKGKASAIKNADTLALEKDISNALGLQTEIVHKTNKHGYDRGGSVTIRYRSLEQLDEITRRLKRG